MSQHDGADNRFPGTPLVQTGAAWNPDIPEVAIGRDLSRSRVPLSEIRPGERLFVTAADRPAVIVNSAEIAYRQWVRKIEGPSLVTATEQFKLPIHTTIHAGMHIRVDLMDGATYGVRIGRQLVLETGTTRRPGPGPKTSLAIDFNRSVAAVEQPSLENQHVLLRTAHGVSTTGFLRREKEASVALGRHRAWIWIGTTHLEVDPEGNVKNQPDGVGAGAVAVLDSAVTIGEPLTIRYRDGKSVVTRLPVTAVAQDIMEWEPEAASLAVGGLRLPLALETQTRGIEIEF